MLIDDPQERERIAEIIREIVPAVDAEPAAGVDDHADRAVLHSYVEELVPDDADRASAALRGAIEAFTVSGGAGLYSGAARAGWVVAHLAGGDVADRACSSIDHALVRRVREDGPPDYDLISGLVGIGVYALERGEAGRELAIAVLDRLEARARPRGPGLAWHTAPELLPSWQREIAPEGYWNLGLAHGAPGAIALLARYLAAGIEPARTQALLDAAVAALLAAAPADPCGRFGGWQVDGAASRDQLGRLAWCYGDLGVSLALFAAGRARDQVTWRDDALAMARSCASRTFADASVHDAGLCHGAAGAAHLFHRLFAATGEDLFATAARTWLDHTLALRSDQPIAGFPSRMFRPGEPASWLADASLLTGATGVALVLHAMICDVDPLWDRIMLVDL